MIIHSEYTNNSPLSYTFGFLKWETGRCVEVSGAKYAIIRKNIHENNVRKPYEQGERAKIAISSLFRLKGFIARRGRPRPRMHASENFRESLFRARRSWKLRRFVILRKFLLANLFRVNIIINPATLLVFRYYTCGGIATNSNPVINLIYIGTLVCVI